MKRLTNKRCNGIKEGYWSQAKKEELVQRLAAYEDTGLEPAEIQQYRAIGTVEECRAAVEKQNPKKPDYESDGDADGYHVYDTWICPNCGTRYEVDYDDYKYCPECGQAIDRCEEE